MHATLGQQLISESQQVARLAPGPAFPPATPRPAVTWVMFTSGPCSSSLAAAATTHAHPHSFCGLQLTPPSMLPCLLCAPAACWEPQQPLSPQQQPVQRTMRRALPPPACPTPGSWSTWTWAASRRCAGVGWWGWTGAVLRAVRVLEVSCVDGWIGVVRSADRCGCVWGRGGAQQ